MVRLIWQCMRLHSVLISVTAVHVGKLYLHSLCVAHSMLTGSELLRYSEIIFFPHTQDNAKYKATVGPKSLHAIYAVGPTFSILTHRAPVCLKSARITQEMLWNPVVQHPNEACQIQSKLQVQSEIQNDILGHNIQRDTPSSWITCKIFNVKKCKKVQHFSYLALQYFSGIITITTTTIIIITLIIK